MEFGFIDRWIKLGILERDAENRLRLTPKAHKFLLAEQAKKPIPRRFLVDEEEPHLPASNAKSR